MNRQNSESQQRIATADGCDIVATVFEPASEAKGVVIVASAMGVAQKYYGDFARWLCQQGYRVATFDYRGIGFSSPEKLRGFKADICLWAEQDCRAVLDYMSESTNGLRLYWIGHSLGGQIIGMVPNCHKIHSAITVASGNGYWREIVRKQGLLSLWVWFVAVPVSLLLFDYFPGKKLRKIGNLPRGVISQWRRWCLSRRYFWDNVEDSVQQQYRSIDFPITFLSFTDDEMMSEASINTVHSFYENAPRTLKRLDPKNEGVKRIGHFGFFKQRSSDTLWSRYIIPELTV